MKLAVVIPALNEEDAIVVVSDGSTDRAVERASKHRDEIDLVGARRQTYVRGLSDGEGPA